MENEKNYRVQIGTIKAATFWNKPTQPDGRGYRSITIVRSKKDRDGNWVDDKMSLFPNELASLIAVLKSIEKVVFMPEQFEIPTQSAPVAQSAPAAQPAATPISTMVGDDIPF